MSTPEKYAEYEELDRQRKRMLAQCYTNSEIPMDADHGKWIEFRKQWEQLVKSLQPGAAHGSEHAAGQLQTLPLTSPVGWPRSTIPNQVPNTMMELFLGAAAHLYETSAAQAPAPPSHLCTQVMAHWLANGTFCRCFLADHPHSSFTIGAHCLAHGLPLTCPHHFERLSAKIPGTVSSVTEAPPKAGNHVVTNIDDECDDEEERESTRICLYLGKDWRKAIPADVYRGLSDNWISEKLLRDSDIVIEPSQGPGTYQGPDGIPLKSKGRVNVNWRLSIHEKTFSGEFQVHASRSGSPDVILGKLWVQKHGATVVSSGRPGVSKDRDAQRPGSDRNGDSRRKHTVSQSIPAHRIMKLSQRHPKNRGAERSR